MDIIIDSTAAVAAAAAALELLNSGVSTADFDGPVVPSVDALDLLTDGAAAVDPPVAISPVVAVPTLPAGLAVVGPVNIVDIVPVVVASVLPVPVVDRAQVRIQSRLDALFAQSQDLPRAERAAMVSSLLFQSSSSTNFCTVPCD